ncbi:MAG: AAA family ATPase [Desulfobacteraceae bacterium]|nr:AAA family ATPase [Desulfobacteraceae bacterium]
MEENRLFGFSDVFVGRTAELELLRNGWEETVAGRAIIISVAGEPGIGKSRLLEIFATAIAHDARVFKGRCFPEKGVPPYFPWVQIISSYVDTCDAKQLQKVLGKHAPIIAEVVNEIQVVLGKLDPLEKLEDPDSARFRLYQSIVAFFKNAATIHPIVIVLDDIQWADAPSLDLLGYLSSEVESTQIMVIVTFRDQPLGQSQSFHKAIARLTKFPRYERIDLRGLTKTDVQEFVEEGAGEAPSPDIVETVYKTTRGNPLFVREFSRMLYQQGNLHSKAHRGRLTVKVPASVQDLIHGWLNGLSIRCNEILETAAVLGMEIGIDALSYCLKKQRRVIHKSLEGAFATKLLYEVPGRRGRYRFTHSLVRQSILASLTAHRLAQLHSQVAQRLEQYYGEAAEDHSAKLANHFRHAVSVLGTEKYIHYSILAGQRAIEQHAYEYANDLFQRAIKTKPQSQTHAQSAQLLFGLGQTKAALNRREEAIVTLTQAFERFVRAGEIDRAIATAQFPFVVSFRKTGAAQLCQRALELVDQKSLDAGRLQCQLGIALAQEQRNYTDAQTACQTSLNIARRHRDIPLETRALLLGAFIDRELQLLEDSLAKSFQSLKLSKKISDKLRIVAGHHLSQEALIASGDFEKGRTHAAEALRVAEQLGDRFWMLLSYASNQRYRIAEGDWKTARSLSDQGLKLDPSDPFLLANRARFELETGDFQTGDIYFHRYIEGLQADASRPWGSKDLQYASMALIVPLICRIKSDTECLDLAESTAHSILDFPLNSPEWRFRAVACLGLTAALRKDSLAAGERYRELVDIVYRDSVPKIRFCRGSLTFVEAQLALIACASGEIDQALTHYKTGIRDCRESGHRPELAWLCYDYARTLLERNHVEDSETAGSLLKEGKKLANELGMPPLKEKIIGLLKDSLSSTTLPDHLTRREVEVLCLLATGLTNQEIASKLFIADRTAANHVSNIFAKIKCGNRVEAAAYAHRHDLTP